MKSSYELAMERLAKASPTVKLNDEQKARMAELDSVYAAKIAEREIFLKGEMDRARAAGEYAAHTEAEQRLVQERRTLQAELEEKKERVREGKK